MIWTADKVLIIAAQNKMKCLHLIWQNYGHTNDFCVDNTLDASGNVIEIALKCEMAPSKVSGATVSGGIKHRKNCETALFKV